MTAIPTLGSSSSVDPSQTRCESWVNQVPFVNGNGSIDIRQLSGPDLHDRLRHMTIQVSLKFISLLIEEPY